jgi:hypothetical protein
MDRKQHQSSENWDAALERALKSLAERQAPATLLPRVMAQVHVRTAEKWDPQPWRRWTFWAWTTTSMLMISLAAWLLWLGGKFYEAKISPALDYGLGICRTVLGALAGSLIGSNFGVGSETYHFTLLAAALLLLAMYVTCVGVGSFVYRVVRR